MKSLSTIVTLALVATGVVADNFTGSCDAKSVKVNGRTLTANCRNIRGQMKCSKLDLNRCIKNLYGSMEPDPTGAGPHLAGQCIQCTNDGQADGFAVGGPTGPSLMHCKCNPGTGAAQANWPTTIFDLNIVVDNNNGILECYRTKGTPC
ncbi:Cyanovirin-N [Madurella mycetomatis]|uniref:Cyanovirin-N n=1 Tax=Madurella mycetomatis TaxID=100816 RepID=A0A175W4Y1_9PEZI|nr:Cyanovirin-N [Madurella mycetomatis]KXX78767.1 Cyanovirin-N [Madurella mycetomatis]